MKHERITARQAKNQIWMFASYSFLGIFWIWTGIEDKSVFLTVAGSVFILLSVGMIFYTLWQRKHFPVEDPALDAQIDENIKTTSTGFAVVMGMILLGFIVAFGLALLLRH